MGGRSSGHWGERSSRSTTDDYRSIDIRKWARSGLLARGFCGHWTWTSGGEEIASVGVLKEEHCFLLSYRQKSGGGKWKQEAYRVPITWTECHLGGSRPWFCCPAAGCGRRVAILYGGAIFACRRCYRLAYPSSRENECYRAARRLNSFRNRCGWDDGFLSGIGEKPKWMRWATFESIEEEHELLTLRALQALGDRFRF